MTFEEYKKLSIDNDSFLAGEKIEVCIDELNELIQFIYALYGTLAVKVEMQSNNLILVYL